MSTCFLGVGSNQRNPARQLRIALKFIRGLPTSSMLRVSSFYWTKAWGYQGQQVFCNAVVEIKTRLSPALLLKACQDIETRQGRIRRRKWGPRVIDIDILIYDTRKIQTETLVIPHPWILQRDFVMKPLQEICPFFHKFLI